MLVAKLDDLVPGRLKKTSQQRGFLSFCMHSAHLSPNNTPHLTSAPSLTRDCPVTLPVVAATAPAPSCFSQTEPGLCNCWLRAHSFLLSELCLAGWRFGLRYKQGQQQELGLVGSQDSEDKKLQGILGLYTCSWLLFLRQGLM